MMKVLAETKGDYQLYDFSTGGMVAAHRPSVVSMSTFLQDRVGREQVRIFGELKSEASDDDFKTLFDEADGNKQFAVDAFLAEFGTDAPEKDETPRKRGSRAPKQDAE